MCDKYHLLRLKYASYRLGVKTKSFAMMKYDKLNLLLNSNMLSFAVWVQIVRKTKKCGINTIRNY